ncbi:9625_t:CDS:2, partial [Funneliformis mosseae]
TYTGINLDDRKISNNSGRKTLVQILKRLNFSNTECMASSRHKSEQGLARYEQPETEMQYNNAMKLAQTFGLKLQLIIMKQHQQILY